MPVFVAVPFITTNMLLGATAVSVVQVAALTQIVDLFTDFLTKNPKEESWDLHGCALRKQNEALSSRGRAAEERVQRLHQEMSEAQTAIETGVASAALTVTTFQENVQRLTTTQQALSDTTAEASRVVTRGELSTQQLQQINEELMARLSQARLELTALMTKLAENDAAFLQTRRDLQLMSETITSNTATISRLQEQIARLTEDSAEKDQLIAGQQEAFDRLDEQNQRLGAQCRFFKSLAQNPNTNPSATSAQQTAPRLQGA